MKLDIDVLRKDKDMRYREYLRRVRIISFLRLIDFIVIIVMLCMTSVSNLYYFLVLLFGCIFILLIIFHDKYYKCLDYYEGFLKILKDYDYRINGGWESFKNTGEEYANDYNAYLKDLDVIGNHSLYQYLCSARTKGGKDRLYDSLNNIDLSLEKLKERQNIIKELSENKEFMLDFQVYLAMLEDNIDLENSYGDIKKKINNDFFLGLFILGNGLSLVSLIFCLCKVFSFKYFYVVVIFKYLFSYVYSFIYKEKLKTISRVSRKMGKLSLLLDSIKEYNFKGSEIKKIKDNILYSKDIIKRFDSLGSFSGLQDNFVLNFIFNGIFTIDPFILYEYYKIQDQEVERVWKSLLEIENMECLISLANIAICRDKVCLAKRCSNVSLNFKGIVHPLLNESVCVANDYCSKENINIITGSNMSGKTSFLRTIGINLILANAGSYVCADRFSSSYFKIFTSMRIQDNIEKGISTFYGELLRISEAIDYQKKDKAMLVLVDEIFKGTNYNDRIFGAESVIKKLNKDNVLLFITTHDFELCDMEVSNLVNYHFSEYYVGDDIKFDYIIKEGKCKTTNAKYLMKRLNILDDDI